MNLAKHELLELAIALCGHRKKTETEKSILQQWVLIKEIHNAGVVVNSFFFPSPTPVI